MTTPVEQQLREYFTTVEHVRGPIDVGTIPRASEAPIEFRLVTDDDSDLNHEGDAMMLTRDPRHRPTRGRAWLVAAAAAMGLVAGLVVATVWTDEAPAPADEPQATVPVTIADDEVRALGFPGSTIEPGRYRTSLLGVPTELTLGSEWSVSDARASFVALYNPSDDGEVDVDVLRWIFLTRLSGWNTATEAVDPEFDGEGSIPPTDVDRWIDENDIVASNRREIEIDGRPAVVVDVTVDPAATGAPLDFPRDPYNRYNDSCTERTAPCLWYRSIPSEGKILNTPRPDPVVHTGQTRRMWLISVGELEPILIEAAAPTGDEAWLDDFENTTIATLDLGQDAPPVE